MPKNSLVSVPPEIYTKDYFLGDCGGYLEFLKSNGLQLSEIMSNALNLAKIDGGMTILDVGCGRGEMILHSAFKKAKVVGIDYSKDAVKIAKELLSKYPDVNEYATVIHGNSTNMLFPSNYFDRVFLLDIIEHLNDNELDKTLDEVYRVLKPEGYVVLHTAPNRWYYNTGYNLYRILIHLISGVKLKKDIRTDYEKRMHVNEQSLISLRKKLEQTGFKFKLWLGGSIDSHQVLNDNLPQGFRRIAYKIASQYPMYYLFRKDIYAVAWKNRDIPYKNLMSTDKILPGENDLECLGSGWYNVEDWPPKIRWTKRKAIAHIKTKKYNPKIYFLTKGNHPDLKEKPLGVSIYINNKLSKNINIQNNEWTTIESNEIKSKNNATIKVTIEVDRTWVPKKYGNSLDNRELGLAVRKIWVG